MSTAPCPVCRKTADLGPKNPKNPESPFCSPRCKLVDLGRWFDGAYVVPGESALDFEAVDLSEIGGDDYAGSNDDDA